MSLATCCKYEYRCTRCFHSLYAMTDEAGTQKPCKYCGQALLLPEATPDRIARAEKVPDEELATSDVPLMFRDEGMTDAEMRQEVKRQMYVPPDQMVCLSNIASSRVKRFFGLLIDGTLLVLMFGVGAALMFWLISAGFIDERALKSKEFTLESFNALAALYFPVVALCLFQWNLIATRGQSIAKFMLGMKIVTEGGRSPGFFRGVVLRNGVPALLNVIPFFGLIDALFILGDSHRCLHDFIAGTHVVDSY